MKRKRLLVIVLATQAALVILAAPAASQTFYREDFAMPGVTTLVGHGWDPTHIGTADALNTANVNTAGVVPAGGAEGEGFHWWFNFTQLQDPVVTVTEASVTAAGEIAAPIAPIQDLAISWEQRLENMQDNAFGATTGIPVVVRVAVQMNGTDWFASNTTYPTTDTGVGNQGPWEAHSLPFSFNAANWRNLTLNTIVPNSPTPQGATIGGAPAGNLSGNITGVGFVSTFSQYGTVNFNFIEVGVPPIPGDVDNDGDVDYIESNNDMISDFDTIRGNFSTAVAGRPQGDLNGDGVVDLFDFGEWKDNFPFPGSGTSAEAGAQVPEPIGPALLAVTLALNSVIPWRKRRRMRLPV
jgi:hypothetical protein